jgi:hypothetical protein
MNSTVCSCALALGALVLFAWVIADTTSSAHPSPQQGFLNANNLKLYDVY